MGYWRMRGVGLPWATYRRTRSSLARLTASIPALRFMPTTTTPSVSGSIGPETGNVVEFNTQHLDTTGQYFRRIGTNYARWNMQDVFWTMRLIPSGLSGGYAGAMVR